MQHAICFLLASLALTSTARGATDVDVILRFEGSVEAIGGGGFTAGAFASAAVGDTAEVLLGVSLVQSFVDSNQASYAVPNEVASVTIGGETLEQSSTLNGRVALSDGPGPTGNADGIGGIISFSTFRTVSLWIQDPSATLLDGFDLAQPAGTLNLPAEAFILVSRGARNIRLQVDRLHVERPGVLGTRVCSPAPANSLGQSAELTVAGFGRVVADELAARATGLPIGSTALLLASRQTGTPLPIQNSTGLLCLSGAVGRFNDTIAAADAFGEARFSIDLARIPQPMGEVAALAGETWSLQAWYRDPAAAAPSNLTDAVSVPLN